MSEKTSLDIADTLIMLGIQLIDSQGRWLTNEEIGRNVKEAIGGRIAIHKDSENMREDLNDEPVLCKEDCHIICDFCKYLMRKTYYDDGMSFCSRHQKWVSWTDGCAWFYCMNVDNQ